MQRQVDVVDRVQLTVLFLALADMVFKPTSEDTAELVIGALVLAGAVAAAVVSHRRGAQQRAA